MDGPLAKWLRRNAKNTTVGPGGVLLAPPLLAGVRRGLDTVWWVPTRSPARGGGGEWPGGQAEVPLDNRKGFGDGDCVSAAQQVPALLHLHACSGQAGVHKGKGSRSSLPCATAVPLHRPAGAAPAMRREPGTNPAPPTTSGLLGANTYLAPPHLSSSPRPNVPRPALPPRFHPCPPRPRPPKLLGARTRRHAAAADGQLPLLRAMATFVRDHAAGVHAAIVEGAAKGPEGPVVRWLKDALTCGGAGEARRQRVPAGSSAACVLSFLVNRQNYAGMSPLHVAAATGHADAVEFLLQQVRGLFGVPGGSGVVWLRGPGHSVPLWGGSERVGLWAGWGCDVIVGEGGPWS